MNEHWKFLTSVIDGEELRIEGLNIWEYPWKDLRDAVYIKDPIYGQDHVFGHYEITDGVKTIRFAAGEFSNLVWGIYLLV